MHLSFNKTGCIEKDTACFVVKSVFLHETYYLRTFISTRLFFALPAAVLLSATG